MWLRVTDGKVTYQGEDRPTDGDGDVFEWFAAVPQNIELVELPGIPGPVPLVHPPDDPRPEGYNDHRSEMSGYEQLLEDEIDFLQATIPDIDTMTAAQVRDTVKRLAQENLRIMRWLRYLNRKAMVT